jgi:hypothetical protein
VPTPRAFAAPLGSFMSMIYYNIFALAGGGPTHIIESAPYWIVLIEEYSPIVAAAIAVIVLSRTGFTKRLAEYRRDTLDLVRLRAETLEKELSTAQMEIQELQRDVRSRDRRIEALEDENDTLRAGASLRPPSRLPRPSLRPESPRPPHAPDVDDRRNDS